MKFIDYYKILGIDKTASSEDIKRAYTKLAKLYHPDRHNSDNKSIVKFTLINEAFSVLGNLENRLKYKIELEQREEIHEKAKQKMKIIKKLENEKLTKNVLSNKK